MPQLLTTNAIIVCPHGGKGTTTPLTTLFAIAGGIVNVEGDSGILACPFAPLPCGGYMLRSMGLNSTTVGGRRAILTTDFNQTFTGLPLLMIETHQGVDNSTTSSFDPTVPLAPELTDVTPPVITTSTPALAFWTTAPAPIAASFQLFAAFPMRWVLTLIDEPLAYSQDLTNGMPPSVTVNPPGGIWTTPSLNITVAMTAPFLAALAPGRHHLYLTGVSRRGLSRHAESIITVTP